MDDPSQSEDGRAKRVNRGLGLAGVDMNLLLGQVKRQVLGVNEPTKISRFELRRRLGAGAMGVVYLAEDPQLDRKVAIKHLHPRLLESEDLEAAQQRLQREAKSMARLTHPNVVTVYEFGADEDKLFIAMEYVEGCTLREWLSEYQRPWTEVLERFLAAGEGLAAAHEAGLVHRDFKPENVLLSEAGEVKVSDFGLASAVMDLAQFEVTRPDGDEASVPSMQALPAALSATGVVLGTPAYMAPERYGGAPADARSDQFSFCVSLYEGLMGRRPFAGETHVELAEAIGRGELHPRPRRGPTPSWLLDVIERGLARDPDQRWPSLAALLDALRDDPRRRRRRVVGMAVAAAAVLGAVGYGAVQLDARQQQVAACEAAGAQIHEDWGPEAVAQWEAAGMPPALVAELSEFLDDYSTQWDGARRQLCVEAEVERSWEPELARAAEHCLDTRRSWMKLLLESYGEAQGAAAWRLGRELLALPSLELCTEPAYLRGLPVLPPEYDAVQGELAMTFAEVELMTVLDRREEAIALAESAVIRARRLHWAPLLARAMHTLGNAYWRGERPLEAMDMHERAYLLALEHDTQPIVVDAALAMAMISGPGPGGPRAVRRWTHLAEIGLGKLERPSSQLTERMNLQRMDMALAGNDVEQVIEFGMPLLLELEERYGAGYPNVEQVRFKLGIAQFRAGRVERAAESFRRVLESSPTFLDQRPGLRVDTHVALSELHTATGDYGLAREQLERALALLPEDSVRVGALSGRLGRVLIRAQEYELAVQMLERGIEVYTQILGTDAPHLAEELEQLARAQLGLGQLEAAQRSYEQALDVHDAWRQVEGPRSAAELREQAREQAANGQLEDALERYADAIELQNRDIFPAPFATPILEPRDPRPHLAPFKDPFEEQPIGERRRPRGPKPPGPGASGPKGPGPKGPGPKGPPPRESAGQRKGPE